MRSDNFIGFQSAETTETFHGALSELIRSGACQIIAQAIKAELQEFLAEYANRRDEHGRQAVVRNGYLPARTIQMGFGDVEVAIQPEP